MTRSHVHSSTATRRRGWTIISRAVWGAFLGALFASFAAPVPALAQGMGVIYYRSGTSNYQVNGDGTGQPLLITSSFQLQRPSARSDYPGGRLFFWNQNVGTIPGTTMTYGNIMVWNQAGTTKPLTAFAGPLYTPTSYTRNQWSNDGQDSFFSFWVYDAVTTRYHLCQANVSAAQVAGPDFQPLVPGDIGTRLKAVTDWAGPWEYSWHPSGTKLYYVDYRVTGHRRLRMKIVGVGLTEDDDLVLFDESVTGVRPDVPLASPTSEQVVLEGYNPATGARQGLISLDPTSGVWAWLITEASGSQTGLRNIANAKFSPDGSAITFGAQRLVSSKKGGTYAYGVHKMLATGGLRTLLTESPSDGYFKNPDGWTW